MARLCTIGYELNSGADFQYEPAFNSNIGAACSTSSVQKRSGSYSLRTNGLSSGAQSGHCIRFLNAAGTIIFVRFYLYIATLPSAENRIWEFGNLATSADPGVTLDNSGVLRLYGASGSLVGTSASGLSTGQWYRIEIDLDASVGDGSDVLRLYVDGSQVAGSTTLSSLAGVLRMVVGGNLSNEAQTTGDWYFDDVAVNDNTGSAQTGLPGAGSVCYLRPNGAGDADTGSPTRGGSDSGTIEGQLDEETPNDATDYVVLPVNPSDFWVDVQNGSIGGIGANDTITLVEVNARVSAASGTASNWFPQIKATSGGTIASATAVAWASASWFTNDDTAGSNQCKLVNYLDPTGAAWTPSTIDSMQISARTTDGNPDTWVSAIWAIVEFVPAAVAASDLPRRFQFVGRRRPRLRREAA